MRYRQCGVMGGKGAQPDQFASTLRGIAIGARGEIYAAGDSEIKVFDAERRFLRRWAVARPLLSVAVATDGSIYAGELRQIEIFDSLGRHVRTWAG